MIIVTDLSNSSSDAKPYAANGNDRGHVWKKYGDDAATVDIFAFSPADPHNGPACVVCGYGYCHHCEMGPDEDCPGPKVSASVESKTTTPTAQHAYPWRGPLTRDEVLGHIAASNMPAGARMLIRATIDGWHLRRKHLEVAVAEGVDIVADFLKGDADIPSANDWINTRDDDARAEADRGN